MKHTFSSLSTLRVRQRGAVLVVSLILLLVMTILAISSSQVVRLQERMAGNIRDMDLAFQGAEAALREGENYIQSLTVWPTACTAPGGSCDMYETAALIDYDLRTTDRVTFWDAYARDYATDVTADLAEDPRYLIERLSGVCDTAEGACLESETLYYFRVTAQSHGGSEIADARLESTYVRYGN